MNLALKDIRFKFGRFMLTTFGISLLLMVVMGMGGIYRGLIQEATLIIDRAGADIWVVQKDTKGPFAEVSKLPRNMETPYPPSGSPTVDSDGAQWIPARAVWPSPP